MECGDERYCCAWEGVDGSVVLDDFGRAIPFVMFVGNDDLFGTQYCHINHEYVRTFKTNEVKKKLNIVIPKHSHRCIAHR